ncbi:MAG: hypothetical protein NZM37_06110 [Sandaracinaceae bacterium]|nr:hypothetical protein [Sandaracinaceae bacterium]MDW8245308.1 hypothetical protein [Sandaracinaceae bacterium]
MRAMEERAKWLGFALIVSLGCTTGTERPKKDANQENQKDAVFAIQDGFSTQDGRIDGEADAPPSCPPGEHLCGRGCVRDLPNEPDRGCRLGCGEPCPAPPMARAACTPQGTCTWDCMAPYRREGNQCVCQPRTCEMIGYECGAPDDGCGRPLDCGSCEFGARCMDGRCTCVPDEFEANDSHTSPRTFSALNDAEDPPDVVLQGNLHRSDDIDWYAFPIVDGGDGGNPRITVELSDIPEGSDYEMSAFYVCGDRTDNSRCVRGSPDNELGHGCRNPAAGNTRESVEIDTDCNRSLSTNDNGTLLVRVRAVMWGRSCSNYRLTIRVR